MAAALAAAAAPGCGFGAGPSSEGEATLTVTRDYGSDRLLSATVSDPPESETVIRVLDREAEIETRYGGGFVQSIEGLGGSVSGGRSFDWFFYVDGIESPVGSAEREVRAGHRIWWDYRDWTDAMRVPAVVGSWPEPLAQEAEDGERLPVRIGCEAPSAACVAVADRLADAGVDAATGDAADGIRVLVGPWRRIHDDPAAALLDRGPRRSGVFARFEPTPSGYELAALDETAGTAAELGAGTGLVAALRDGESPPTWLVTGTDSRGVRAAAGLLETEQLADRYAVAIDGRDAVPLPVIEGDS